MPGDELRFLIGECEKDEGRTKDKQQFLARPLSIMHRSSYKKYSHNKQCDKA
jgi:hypothetical protein